MAVTGLTRFALLACSLPAFAMSATGVQAQDRVYWSDNASNRISSANIDGSGAGAHLMMNAVDGPVSIAFDPARDRIYWASWNTDEIMAANLSDPSSATTLYSGGIDPYGVQIDSATQTLYWTDSGNSLVVSAPANGSGPIKSLFTDPTQPSGVALDLAAGKIYWANYANGAPNTGKISVGSIDGSGTPTVLHSGLNGPTGLAIDPATNTMWVTLQDDNAIMRGTLDGGPLTSIDSGVTSPEGVAADLNGGHIFWANQNPDSIAKATLAGSNTSLLNVSPVAPSAPLEPTLLEDPNSTAAPGISGTTTVGSRLSCTQGGWAGDLPGAQLYQAPRSFAYQWRRDGANIAGATNSTLQLSQGGSYACAVTATNYAGSTTQSSTAAVVPSAITELKASPKMLPRVNRGTSLRIKFRLRLANSAPVKLRIQRKYGRKKSSCKQTDRENVHRKRCTIYRSVMSKTKTFKPGTNQFTIPSATVRNKFRSGAYRATLTATTGGVTSPPARVLFYVSWK